MKKQNFLVMFLLFLLLTLALNTGVLQADTDRTHSRGLVRASGNVDSQFNGGGNVRDNANNVEAAGLLPSCTYSLNPTSANFEKEGGTGSTSVTTQSGCNWQAVSNNSWITINSGADGFSSDFNNDASGWTQHYGTWTVDGGYYNTPGDVDYVASASHDGDYSDFTYRASMKREGCADCANSIFVRGTPEPLDAEKDWYKTYDFGYSNDGYYRIWKAVDGFWTELQTWTFTSAISATGWNELKVVASGSSLSKGIQNDVDVTPIFLVAKLLRSFLR